MMVGILAIMLAIFVGESPVLFEFAFILFGFAASSIGTLGPLLTTELFGKKEYSRIYSTAAMGMAGGGVLALPGYGFIYDAVQSYIPVLWIICVMFVISIFCILLSFAGILNRREKRCH